MFKSTAATIGALAVVVGLAVGGWFLYWTLHRSGVNREAEIQQGTYGRQNALVEQIIDDIVEAQDDALPANQRAAIVDRICDSAAKLNHSIDLPAGVDEFLHKECPLL